MTKEDFKPWIVYNTNRKYVNPYDEWTYRKVLSIVRSGTALRQTYIYSFRDNWRVY